MKLLDGGQFREALFNVGTAGMPGSPFPGGGQGITPAVRARRLHGEEVVDTILGCHDGLPEARFAKFPIALHRCCWRE